jgi:hypothetical protein
MDLKLYYQKIRDTEAKISDAFPVIVSRATQDGGKEGSCAEVTRGIAAKMIAEGVSRLATPDEAKAFRESQLEAKRLLDHAAEAAKVQFAVLSTSELNKLKSAQKGSKDQA